MLYLVAYDFQCIFSLSSVIQVKGDTTVEDVFGEIDKLLTSSLDKKTEMVATQLAHEQRKAAQIGHAIEAFLFYFFKDMQVTKH